MRGLTIFISDIKNCQTKDAEEKRVLKEMAKIREKFSNSRKAISAYDRKKYIWKLLYIHMLGYDADFGHIEAINMICSPRYSEKYTGYMAASLLLTPTSPLLEQVINAIRNDLLSIDPVNQALALSTIANVSGKLIVDELGKDVLQLLFNDSVRLQPDILKKVVSCLSKLFRYDKNLISAGSLGVKINELLESKMIGLLLSLCGLLLQVIPVHGYDTYKNCFGKLVSNLYRLALTKEVSSDYMYYQTACPWLQIKLLKVLQLFPFPIDSRLSQDITDTLQRIITTTDVTRSINKNNTDHSILFEAINLVIHYKENISSTLRAQASTLLAKFISVKEPNIRYIGLETMARLSEHPESRDMISKHQETVLISLKDPDISIRKRALDVLFAMCNEVNSTSIIEELLNSTKEADFTIKEDIVQKTALLAERFSKDLKSYIDVIIQLITYAGDYVSNDIWYRLVQVVTGFGESPNVSLQEYAVGKASTALALPHIHDSMVKLAAILIGEFSSYINDPQSIFDQFQRHFPHSSIETKCIVLSCYMKLTHAYPVLVNSTFTIFEHHTYHLNPDLQQRALEYYNLCSENFESIRNSVIYPMPTYSEDLQKQNMLIQKIVNMENKEEKRVPSPVPISVDLLSL